MKDNGIFADLTPHITPFIWDGVKYDFETVEPTWVQKNSLLSKCMSVDKSGKPSIDVSKYNEEMLMIILRDSCGLFEINKLEFKKFSEKFGDALEKQIIPNPFDTSGMSEEDEKN